MPWKRTDVMEQRIRFVAQALRDPVNFSELCRGYGVARSTGYRWVKRYLEVGHFYRLSERSRRPHHSPLKTPEAIEARVVALRCRHGWGARKLQVLLQAEEVNLSEITLNRIIKRNGLLREKDCHRPATRRFERAQPNELWQMDFKGQYRTRTGECYPLSILDDHSRFAVGLYALAHPRALAVHRCLVKTFRQYGLPEGMLIDHGSPWWSTTNAHGLTWLSVRLIKQGIRLHLSGIRHPQTQGKVERFHRTLDEAVAHRGRPETLSGFETLLPSIRQEYNCVRPHEALGMAVPASRYRPSLTPYNPNPPEWIYPRDLTVRGLNTQGCLEYRHHRYFVCEALAGERVALEEADGKLLVSYRHMYIREIDLRSHTTRPLTQARDFNRV